ncbi:MAG: hypothetical protein R2795_10070 [Saprospiraceae bacterium]
MHSKNEGQCATARVQLRINLKDNSYQNIQVNSFRDNDQSFAHQILDVLEEGALVIRDQGYFVLSVFKKSSRRKHSSCPVYVLGQTSMMGRQVKSWICSNY